MASQGAARLGYAMIDDFSVFVSAKVEGGRERGREE